MTVARDRLRFRKIQHGKHTLMVNVIPRPFVGHRCVVMGSMSKFSDGETVEEAVNNCIEDWCKPDISDSAVVRQCVEVSDNSGKIS